MERSRKEVSHYPFGQAHKSISIGKDKCILLPLQTLCCTIKSLQVILQFLWHTEFFCPPFFCFWRQSWRKQKSKNKK